jgi:class 3 adenylate cyclase
MTETERRLIIILADISGYTRFMSANQLSAVHGQQLITALIERILREVDIPLVLQEIEGDAIFLYVAHPGSEEGWEEALSEVRLKLECFFGAFLEELVKRAESTLCECLVCEHLDSLKLKIVVHSGEAVFHEIAGRPQVSGVDVIAAHRLLKNSVPSDEYLLMSERAYEELGSEMEGAFDRGEETYDSLETVVTYVRLMGENREKAREEFYALSEAERKANARYFGRWALAGAVPELWRHIRRPANDSGLGARLGFALKFLLNAPWLYAKMLNGVPGHVRARHARYRRESAARGATA